MSSEPLSSEPALSESDANALTADIRSTDGKSHKMIFDQSKELLEFSLSSSKSNKQPCRMLKDINELLSVRATPIIMRRGLPVDLNKDASHNDTPNSLYLYFAEQGKKSRWRVREVIALFTTSREKKHWLAVLNTALKGLKKRPKSLLIFVNPFGGHGKAKNVYAKKVEMILEMANIECEVVITQRADHAKEAMKSLEESKWKSLDGVISVGGDGLFNECLYSILARTQEEVNKDISDLNIDCLETPRMRFGIIGAGSANSIVSSVHGTADCSTAAIHIAMGSECAVDVCAVNRDEQLIHVSANAISFGWLGDVISDSEHYRWMGPLRYKFSALREMWINPSYFGRVSFCPINEGSADLTFPECEAGCAICESSAENDGPYTHHVQASFSHVIGCVNPCVSPFSPYGLAPYAGVGDGTMDVAIVPKVRRRDNLSFMWKIARHGGKSVIGMKNLVHVYRLTRWAFVPRALVHPHCKASVRGDQGAWNLDGEIMDQPNDSTLHFRLHPRLIKYFGREADEQETTKSGGLCVSPGGGKKKHSAIVHI